MTRGGRLVTITAIVALAGIVLALRPSVFHRLRHRPNARVDSLLAPASAPTIAPGEIGAIVPELSLTDIHGRRLSPEDLQGKVILLDYWAPWCKPCESEMPGYQQLQQKYRDRNFLVIGVVFDPGMPMGKETPAHFAKRLHISYALVKDFPELQSLFGGIQGIPTTFLIDYNRVIRYKVVGFEYTDKIEGALQPLL